MPVEDEEAREERAARLTGLSVSAAVMMCRYDVRVVAGMGLEPIASAL